MKNTAKSKQSNNGDNLKFLSGVHPNYAYFSPNLNKGQKKYKTKFSQSTRNNHSHGKHLNGGINHSNFKSRKTDQMSSRSNKFFQYTGLETGSPKKPAYFSSNIERKKKYVNQLANLVSKHNHVDTFQERLEKFKKESQSKKKSSNNSKVLNKSHRNYHKVDLSNFGKKSSSLTPEPKFDGNNRRMLMAGYSSNPGKGYVKFSNKENIDSKNDHQGSPSTWLNKTRKRSTVLRNLNQNFTKFFKSRPSSLGKKDLKRTKINSYKREFSNSGEASGNEDTNSYIKRVKNYLQRDITPCNERTQKDKLNQSESQYTPGSSYPYKKKHARHSNPSNSKKRKKGSYSPSIKHRKKGQSFGKRGVSTFNQVNMANKIRGYISNNNFYKGSPTRKSTKSNSNHSPKASRNKTSSGMSHRSKNHSQVSATEKMTMSQIHYKNNGKNLNSSKSSSNAAVDSSYSSILAKHVTKKKKRMSNTSGYSPGAASGHQPPHGSCGYLSPKQGGIGSKMGGNSPLLKKSFRKSKTPGSGPKHSRKKGSNSRVKSGSTDPKMIQNFESYFKLNKFAGDILKKIPNLDFFARTGRQIFEIFDVMRANKDVYEKIRLYADMAQELEFESIHKIFSDSDAKKLFSKVFKLERWSIILIFYFKVIKKSSPKLMGMLKGLIEHVWSNQNNLVNWVNVLQKKHNIGWDLSSLGDDIYTLHPGDEDSMIVKVVNTCQLIIGYIIKIQDFLNEKHHGAQKEFLINIDAWSVGKCFEKGFECFYHTFSMKGVISVSTEAQMNEDTGQNSAKNSTASSQSGGAAPAGHNLGSSISKDLINDSSVPSNKNSESIYKAPLEQIIEEEAQPDTANTPTKKTKLGKLTETGELDNYEQPTMRKSFGDKSSSFEAANETQKEEEIEENQGNSFNTSNDSNNMEEQEEEEDHLGSFEEVLQKMRQEENEEVPVFLFQPNTNEMRQDRMLLPRMQSDRSYTLVLDLDETLIHFEEKSGGTSQFLIRPFAQYFLKKVSKFYEVVIFTAALQDYADYILDRMDTTNCIRHRLYRQHTNFSNNIYQKDLSRIGRDLSRTLIVDNNAENFQLQPDNGIYIKSWYDDPDDQALSQLCPLLIDIVKKKYDDVRVALKCFREKMSQNYRTQGGSDKNLTLSLEPPNNTLVQ